MKLVRAHVVVSGFVQGVFFRSNTVKVARSLGLTGWVRNIEEGVEAVFEGDEEKVSKIIEWCQKGPPASNVSDVKVKFEEYRGSFNSFERR